MRFIFGLRGTRLALATMAILAAAGGIAYASIPDAGTSVYHACMLKNIGTIRIIDPDKQHCSAALETEITFNQKGPKGDQGIQGPQGPAGAAGRNGTNGVSPTVTQLAAGDVNCPAGGAAIKDAAGSTAYVCSGQPFSGTFTSPNGDYSISVTNSGVTLTGVDSSINLSGIGVTVDAASSIIVQSGNDLTLLSGNAATLQSGTSLSLQSGTAATLKSGSGLTLRSDNATTLQSSTGITLSGAGAVAVQGGNLTLDGGTVRVNGGSCRPAARLGDSVGVTPAGDGAPVVGSILTGSTSVCIG